MKETKGYLTENGTFFENKAEATLYEAELRLRSRLADFNGRLDHEKFLEVVLAVMPELGEYIHAFYATRPAEPDSEVEDREETDDRPPPEIAGGTGHVSSAEEDLASLLKLPPRGPGNVPDVGGSPRTTKVSKRRQKHGA
jgi:hypothetical protein